jgi:hypothetical protein
MNCGSKVMAARSGFNCSTSWIWSPDSTQAVGRVRYADPVGGGVWWWHVATGWF